ncbi:MAG: DNA translocase FtsK, partial [Muribaculaceae bacterium]|nr:DNA translocase FtsK [Muribaculaceae bacterium]
RWGVPPPRPPPARPGGAPARRGRREAAPAPDESMAREPRRKEAPKRQPAKEPRKRPDARPGWLRFFADKRVHRAAGVVLVVLAAVVFIVTLSHLRTGAADQSAIEGMSVGQMAKEGTQVENAGGPFGAKLSQWLFADGLGLGAFVVVAWLGLVGAALLKLVKVNFWALTAKCFFTAIAVSMVFGLLFFNAESYVSWGGAHGHYANEWLMSVGNALLAVAVSVCLVGVLACIYLNELASGYRRVSGTLVRKREAWRKAREEERERRAAHMAEPESADDDADTRKGMPERLPAAVVENGPEEDNDPVHAVSAPGFDIDDLEEEEGDGPRARTLDDVRDDVRADAEAEEEQDETDDADAAEEVDAAEEAVAAEAGETEFVVRAAETGDEAFTIDEDEPDEDDGGRESRVRAVLDSEPFDPRAELSRYRFPDVDLLIARNSAPVIDMEEQKANKDLIEKTLLDYKIPIERIEATVGPTVTLYEVKPAEGVRIAQIKRLEDDIALSLSALGIRIIAPIPGKDVVGIEVPNRDPQIVSIRNVFNSRKFRECDMRLPMAMGATISNDIFIADLAKMPHLLVAGATGQGKSVGLNCILASLLYKKHPAELKFVLIDPKMVEFSLYSKLERHYIAKLPDEEEAIVTDPLKAAATLHSLCIEMDNRYQLLRQAQVRNLEEYNEKFQARRLNPEHGHRYMPYIVMVVDEFADLIMQAGKEVSLSIARIAQKARAVGMHMIIATQRPSTDVISGMIKNNFPGRIAFKVSQMVDSRTILDSPGANRLIGRGDMLFSHNSAMTRVQCALIETSEVEAIVDHINDQIGYSQPYLLPEIPVEGGGAGGGGMVDLSKRDAMFDECARFIVTQSTASTSMLQRRFGIGYNKAGKIMDQMEAAGIVGPACGQKPRTILVDSITVEDIINNG